MKPSFIITLVQNVGDETTSTEIQTGSVTLPELLQDIENLLRGAGFVVDGHLEIIKEDE